CPAVCEIGQRSSSYDARMNRFARRGGRFMRLSSECLLLINTSCPNKIRDSIKAFWLLVKQRNADERLLSGNSEWLPDSACVRQKAAAAFESTAGTSSSG